MSVLSDRYRSILLDKELLSHFNFNTVNWDPTESREFVDEKQGTWCYYCCWIYAIYVGDHQNGGYVCDVGYFQYSSNSAAANPPHLYL